MFKAIKTKLVLSFLLFNLSLYSQTLENVKVYRDPYNKVQLKEEYTIIKGTNTKHGSYKSYDLGGDLIEKGNFSNGKSNGKWSFYFGTLDVQLGKPKSLIGKEKEFCYFSAGKRNGKRVVYGSFEGKRVIKSEYLYKNDEVFKEISYWNNGTKEEEIKLNGKCYAWNKSGIKTKDYFLDEEAKENGLYTEWYENGNKLLECNYSHGNLIGKCNQWYEKGQLAIERVYSDQFFIVENTEYSQSGSVITKLTSSGVNYKEIKFDSVTEVKLHEADFVLLNSDLIKDGKEVTYFLNGKKESEGINAKGLKEGKFSFWYQDGTLKAEKEYKNGKQINTSKEWSNSGVLLKSMTYNKNSYLMKKEEFYNSGTPKLKSLTNGEETNYYKSSKLKSKGENKKGKRIGEWKFYKEDGSLDYVELERNDGRRYIKSSEELKREREYEEKKARLKLEKENKIKAEKELVSKKAEYALKVKQVDEVYESYKKDEVVMEGVFVSKSKITSKKKKNLYLAYLILENSLQSDFLEVETDIEKLKVLNTQLTLLDKMLELRNAETKAKEKLLKKETNTDSIRKIIFE